MKKLALAMAALVLGACATTNGGNGARTTAAGTQYCWQERLSSAGGKHTCNWAPSFRDACESTQLSALDTARYSAPQKTRMCSNGQWLVEVAPKG